MIFLMVLMENISPIRCICTIQFSLTSLRPHDWRQSRETGVKNICRTKSLRVGSADASTPHYFLELLEKI